MQLNKFQKLNLIILVISSLLYLLNELYFKGLKIEYIFYFMNSHFNDLIASLVILAFANLLLGFVQHRIDKFKYIILFILGCSIVWEGLGKFARSNAVFDWIDVICYFLGAIIYYIIIKIDKNKSITN